MDPSTKASLIGEARLLGSNRIRGRLLQLVDYPTAISSVAGWVVGEVYVLQNFPEQILQIDQYEGCDGPNPQLHEYHRNRLSLWNGTRK